MKRYLIEVIFYFLIPAALIAIAAEYSLRAIPNDYAYKNQWLVQNSREVEVLAFGASSILYDFDPQYLERNGFNAAHVSQSLKFDHLIFNKFVDQMPSLEYVIMGIDFWTPFGEMESTPEWWRVKYYNIYYGSKLYRFEGKYNYELYFRDIGTFKRAALGFLTLLGIRNETHVMIGEKGYGLHYTIDNRVDTWDNGTVEAARHNALVGEAIKSNYVEQNRRYVEEIIKKSEEIDAKVLLINVPLCSSYKDNLMDEYVNMQKEFCRYFVEKYNNVLYFDFSSDPAFTEDDFYDSNHLNEKGSEKFTRMLNTLLVSESSQLFTVFKNDMEK